MKKDDLKTGMVVELNNGIRYMVIKGDKNILIAVLVGLALIFLVQI